MMSVDSLSDDTPERLSHLEEGDVNIVYESNQEQMRDKTFSSVL